MKRFFIPFLVLGIALLAFTLADDSKKITLRYVLSEGEVYDYEANMDVSQSNVKNPADVIGGTTMKMKYAYTVAEPSEKKMNIEMLLKSVKMSMNMMGMSLDYDSEDGEADDFMTQQIASQFDKILNKPVPLQIDDLGKLENEDDLAKGSDMVGNNMRNIFIPFPEDPISEGSTWNDKTEMEGVEIDTRYTVKKINAKSVELEMKGGFVFEEGGKKFDVKLSGLTEVERKTGMAINQKMEIILPLDVPELGGEMSMKMKMNVVRK